MACTCALLDGHADAHAHAHGHAHADAHVHADAHAHANAQVSFSDGEWWHVDADGEVQGPHTWTEFTTIARGPASTLTADTFVFMEGMSEWLPADAVPGLLRPYQPPAACPSQPSPAEVEPAVDAEPAATASPPHHAPPLLQQTSTASEVSEEASPPPPPPPPPPAEGIEIGRASCRERV